MIESARMHKFTLIMKTKVREQYFFLLADKLVNC